jgi:uncharacterized repeat protein (TIGR03803 family)
MNHVYTRLARKTLAAAGFRGALTLTLFSAGLLLAARPAQAQYETVYYNFPEIPYGETGGPESPLTFNGTTFFGTSDRGGSESNGLVYSVPAGKPGYETNLYSFTGGSDGALPAYSAVTMGKDGVLYGTTSLGGANGCGVVWQLTPDGVNYTESTLYSFPAPPGANENDDNCTPMYGVILGKNGDLFGTTTYSGQAGGTGGSVFELQKNSDGEWTEKSLYTFPYGALSGLTMDADGNLYGVGSTSEDYGYLFELSKVGGKWTPTVIYTFTNSKDGNGPFSTPVLDAAGNIFGTSESGGTAEGLPGVVFEASPNTKKPGQWTFRLLHAFNGKGWGGSPTGVILDQSGNIYGTTQYGGPKDGYGVLYELVAPVAEGKSYTEKVLLSFDDEDGNAPLAPPTFDNSGNLYGATSQGGAYSAGLVYEYVP